MPDGNRGDNQSAMSISIHPANAQTFVPAFNVPVATVIRDELATAKALSHHRDGHASYQLSQTNSRA